MDFGSLGYYIASGFFSILVIILVTRWRGRLKGGLLLVAVLSCLLWSLSMGIHGYSEQSFYRYPVFFEALRNIALYVFLLSLLSPAYKAKGQLVIFYSLSSLAYLAALLVLAGAFFINQNMELSGKGFNIDYRTILIGSLSLPVLGLVIIEQLFRNTRPEKRWSTKFLFIGVGLIFIYDVFLYSDALLFSSISRSIWSGRGYVIALSAPLLAVAAARNPKWSLDVFVSRQLVFHTTALIGVGVYLLVMASAGYYIKIYGGNWGGVAQIVFLFLAFLVLLAIFFSGDVRARIKVFISKHFFNYRYDYRDEWLKITRKLSKTGIDSDLNDTVITSIADLVESQGGMLWLLNDDKDAYRCVRRTIFPEVHDQERIGGSLTTLLSEKNWVVDLDEYKLNPGLYKGLDLPEWLRKLDKAWLVIPMIHLKSLIGFLVIAQSRAYRKINWEDRDLLKTASMQASSYLAFQEASESLAKSEKFAVFNRLSAFVVHDLKNLITQLDLVVRNAEKFKNKPEFVDDAFETVQNASLKMGKLLTQLRQGRFEGHAATIINVNITMKEIVSMYEGYLPKPELHCASENIRISANGDRFVSIVGHIVKNAQEATGDDGFIKIDVFCEQDNVVIQIEDNGCGMSEDFIKEKLFSPFITTKGNAGMGVGVYECREFVRANGGEVVVSSSSDKGTVFKLVLPRYKN